jgi:hypothetical protein
MGGREITVEMATESFPGMVDRANFVRGADIKQKLNAQDTR